MITATVKTDKYKVKTAHYIKSMSNIRLIIPKGWDCEYVNVMLWEEDICTLKSSNPAQYELIVPQCAELFLKKVIRDDQRNYVYLPPRYDGQQVLIVPV